MSTAHEALGRDLVAAAVLRGSFRLRSGAQSSYYIDKYLFTTNPDLLARITNELAGNGDRRVAGLDRVGRRHLGVGRVGNLLRHLVGDGGWRGGRFDHVGLRRRGVCRRQRALSGALYEVRAGALTSCQLSAVSYQLSAIRRNS